MKPARLFEWLPLSLWNPRSLSLFVAVLILCSCQAAPQAPLAPQHKVASLSEKKIGAEPGRYVIRSDLSEARILVFRAGPLAAVGHNHVIQATGMAGEIYLERDFHRSRFSLILPVAEMLVDATEARSEEGKEFAGVPDAEAIAGTTRNMQGEKVLHAALYPYIAIHSVGLSGTAWSPEIRLRVRFKDSERDFTLPVAIDYRANEITVTTQFEIKQTDLGITPLSILGGAIQVANALRVRLRIVAQRG